MSTVGSPVKESRIIRPPIGGSRLLLLKLYFNIIVTLRLSSATFAFKPRTCRFSMNPRQAKA